MATTLTGGNGGKYDMSQRDLALRHPDEVLELQALLKKVEKDKPKAADRLALALYLGDHPNVWRYVGDLMEQATLSLIRKMPSNAVTQEALTAASDHLPQELALPGDGALEQLLIQHVVLCWLRLAHVEYQYTGVTVTGENTITRVEHWDKRLNVAQRRYLRAIESLARVRKLRVPAVQVNIGAQQVNQVNASH
jgi:hypothetical protein